MQEELEAVYRFRYTVYCEEYGRSLWVVDHERRWVYDDEDVGEHGTIFYTGALEDMTGRPRAAADRAGGPPRPGNSPSRDG